MYLSHCLFHAVTLSIIPVVAATACGRNNPLEGTSSAATPSDNGSQPMQSPSPAPGPSPTAPMPPAPGAPIDRPSPGPAPGANPAPTPPSSNDPFGKGSNASPGAGSGSGSGIGSGIPGDAGVPTPPRDAGTRRDAGAGRSDAG